MDEQTLARLERDHPARDRCEYCDGCETAALVAEVRTLQRALPILRADAARDRARLTDERDQWARKYQQLWEERGYHIIAALLPREPPMDEPELARLEAAHQPYAVGRDSICVTCTSNSYEGGQAVGGQADGRWPCDAARLVAEVRRLQAEVESCEFQLDDLRDRG